MGEIVRRVTGKNIRQVVDEEFRGPLGWRWMNFGVKRRDVPKVASSYFTGLPMIPPLGAIAQRVLGIDFVEAVELSNDPRYLMGVLPAANLIATADELSQFYQLLLQGGELNGKRIFDNRTVWRATSEQSYGELDFTLGVPLRYGMGFMLGGEWLSLYGFDSQHAFGHLGLTNIVGWADPQRHLSVAVMTSGKPVFYPEMHRGVQLVYTIASSCPKDPDVGPRLREEPRPRTKKKGRKAAKAVRPARAKKAAAKEAATKSPASKKKPSPKPKRRARK
jgi:CubicO group peptidase (beta-lactamase class C family)